MFLWKRSKSVEQLSRENFDFIFLVRILHAYHFIRSLCSSKLRKTTTFNHFIFVQANISHFLPTRVMLVQRVYLRHKTSFLPVEYVFGYVTSAISSSFEVALILASKLVKIYREFYCVSLNCDVFERKIRLKHICLPVGELNPGLPRDRRGYSPLY